MGPDLNSPKRKRAGTTSFNGLKAPGIPATVSNPSTLDQGSMSSEPLGSVPRNLGAAGAGGGVIVTKVKKEPADEHSVEDPPLQVNKDLPVKIGESAEAVRSSHAM